MLDLDLAIGLLVASKERSHESKDPLSHVDFCFSHDLTGLAPNANEQSDEHHAYSCQR